MIATAVFLCILAKSSRSARSRTELEWRQPLTAQAIQDQVIIGILSCMKLSSRRMYLANSWIRNARAINGVNAVFVIGRQDLGVEFFLQHEELFVAARDDYENLPQKVLAFFNAAFALGYDRAVKVDDESFVFVPEFVTLLSNTKQATYACVVRSANPVEMEKTYNRSWHQGKCQNDNYNSFVYNLAYKYEYCLGAPGYALDRTGMRQLRSYYMENFTDNCRAYEIYEDVLIGKILAHHGIYPTELVPHGITCRFGETKITPDCLTVIDVSSADLGYFRRQVEQYPSSSRPQSTVFRGPPKRSVSTLKSVSPFDVGAFAGCSRSRELGG